MPQSIARLKMLTFFASLYFLQGAAFAYVVNFQKPYLAGQGVSKESLGLFTSLLLLPFILKIFLGMLSDRVPIGKWGSRKPYMVMGLVLFAFCYFLLSFVKEPSVNFLYFAGVTWLASLGLALFDTGCDGFALDVASKDEQSLVQAAMVAGRSLGLITMAAGFGWLAGVWGFHLVFLLLAALALVMIFVVINTNLRPRREINTSRVSGRWRDLLRPAYLIFATFGVVYSISSFGADGIGTLFLSEARDVSPEGLGTFGAARGMGALLGAGAFAWLAIHLALARIVMICVAGLGVGCLTFLTPMPLPLAGLIWGFFWGAQETAYVTLAMRYSTGRWAATFFAIAMIFSNVGTAVGEGLAAPMAASYGYAAVFSGFAILAWLLLPLVAYWNPEH